jgi:hypothetical protein
MSMNMLTNLSAQMLRGRLRNGPWPWGGGSVFIQQLLRLTGTPKSIFDLYHGGNICPVAAYQGLS